MNELEKSIDYIYYLLFEAPFNGERRFQELPEKFKAKLKEISNNLKDNPKLME